jgi:hypothetical protein
MSAKLIIAQSELVEIVAPYPEPRLVYQNAEPRKVNNLTLIARRARCGLFSR